MYVDSVLAYILVCLGAMLSYAVDEQIRFTPRIAEWIGRILNEI